MIYAIADLHFDFSKEKPMDVFGDNWKDHDKKIISDWKEKVRDDDLVLLPGDISWALKLKDAVDDLNVIDSLPGKKIISKGNHDYWWSSLNKMNNLGFKTIKFLYNNTYEYEDISICGCRGWISKDSLEFTQEDEKIYNREVNRLKISLEQAKNKKIIALIHYPPFNQDHSASDFTKLLTDFNVKLCLYGHLHGQGHKYRYEGELDNVSYKFIASDFLDFKLERIRSWKEK